jgi:hypothetical protein
MARNPNEFFLMLWSPCTRQRIVHRLARAEAISFFSSKGLPFGWRINPEDTPVDMPKRLEGLGFARDDTPGMAIDLALLSAPEPPPGLRIEKVRGKNG